jgi:hypothetical protein
MDKKMRDRVAQLRDELVEISTLYDVVEARIKRTRDQLRFELLELRVVAERRDHLREIVGKPKKS